MSSSSDKVLKPKKTKNSSPKQHRQQKFTMRWLMKKDFAEWLRPDEKDAYRAKCIVCESTMHANISMLKRHKDAKKHIAKVDASKNKQPLIDPKQESVLRDMLSPKTEHHNLHNYENRVIVTNEAGETITTLMIENPSSEQNVRTQNPSISKIHSSTSTPGKLNNAYKERKYKRFVKDSFREWEIFGSFVAMECHSMKSKSLKKELKQRLQEVILEYSKKDGKKRHTTNATSKKSNFKDQADSALMFNNNDHNIDNDDDHNIDNDDDHDIDDDASIQLETVLIRSPAVEVCP